jgi:phospholipase C
VTEQDNPEQSGNSGDPAKSRTIRRAFMVGGTAAAFAAAVAGRPGGQHSITDDQARLIDKVTASATANASLGDVKHIVILMQENRSFDHYFGTLSGVRGFSDPKAAKNANGTPVFDQYGYQPGTGTAGEYLTTLPSSAGGIAGPIGLGFRTPCLVISPFTAGGYKYSGVLDHTSTLRLIEKGFGVTVPNLTAWRRSVTGDFTGALNLVRPPVTKVPALPSTSIGSNLTVVEEAVLNAGCTPAAPASPATDLHGTSSYQFRGDKSGNPDSKVVITDRKMLDGKMSLGPRR